MWLINLLKKRPSDNTIRLSRIIFALVYMGVLYYNFIVQNDPVDLVFFWYELSFTWGIYSRYVIMSLWAIPLIMWVTNLCILKSKYMRIAQIFFGIILFYISSKIWYESRDLEVDTLIFLMGFIPLICWITWKCITTKCSRFQEKITKVRV